MLFKWVTSEHVNVAAVDCIQFNDLPTRANGWPDWYSILPTSGVAGHDCLLSKTEARPSIPSEMDQDQ